MTNVYEHTAANETVRVAPPSDSYPSHDNKDWEVEFDYWPTTTGGSLRTLISESYVYNSSSLGWRANEYEGLTISLRMNTGTGASQGYSANNNNLVESGEWNHVKFGYNAAEDKMYLEVTNTTHGAQTSEHLNWGGWKAPSNYRYNIFSADTTSGTQIANVRITENNGAHKVFYACDEGAGLVMVNAEASTGSDWDGVITADTIHATGQDGGPPSLETPPTFETEPQDAAVTAPDGHTFTSSATGTEPITYAWEYNPGTGYVDATTLSGVTDSTTQNLVVASTDPSDGVGGTVRVTASGISPPAVSRDAAFTITQIVVPTSTQFGPLLCSDTNATLTWQYRLPAGANEWVELGNPPTAPGLDLTYAEQTPDGEAGSQPKNTLLVNSASASGTTRFQCTATSGYQSGLTSSEGELIVEDAP